MGILSVSLVGVKGLTMSRSHSVPKGPSNEGEVGGVGLPVEAGPGWSSWVVLSRSVTPNVKSQVRTRKLVLSVSYIVHTCLGDDARSVTLVFVFLWVGGGSLLVWGGSIPNTARQVFSIPPFPHGPTKGVLSCSLEEPVVSVSRL